jgi:predicted nuclease of predicted toxin-antitoxin system
LKGFLLDENVPSRLTISASFPVVHCLELGQSLSDTALWEHAQSNRYAIVTKDVDFSNRIMLSPPPPWIVHLRIGNMRRREFHAFLERIWPEVESLLPEHKLVNVYEDRIEAIGISDL